MIFIPVLVFSWRFSRGLRHWGLAVEREGELKPPKKPKMKPKFAAFAATRRILLASLTIDLPNNGTGCPSFRVFLPSTNFISRRKKKERRKKIIDYHTVCTGGEKSNRGNPSYNSNTTLQITLEKLTVDGMTD